MPTFNDFYLDREIQASDIVVGLNDSGVMNARFEVGDISGFSRSELLDAVLPGFVPFIGPQGNILLSSNIGLTFTESDTTADSVQSVQTITLNVNNREGFINGSLIYITNDDNQVAHRAQMTSLVGNIATFEPALSNSDLVSLNDPLNGPVKVNGYYTSSLTFDGKDITPSTITVGNTTTSASGTDANVINSGTSLDVVLEFTIPRGNTGATGSTGSQGIQGDRGPQGVSGGQGLEGPQGPEGPQGEVGPQGIQGIQGIEGPEGPVGDTGPQGDQGPQGNAGVQGDQGIQGETGPKGETGRGGLFDIEIYISSATDPGQPTGGTFTVDTGVIVPPTGWTTVLPAVVAGFNNYESRAGINPNTGINVITPLWSAGFVVGGIGPAGATGPQGDQGIQGLPGNDGADGAKGDKGDTGDTGAQGIQGDVGSQGTQGIQGEQGVQGNTGATGTNGLKGDQGDAGAMGIQGIQGEPGTDGTNGTNGTDGAPGADGLNGQGIIPGGTAGQVLTKIDETDYNTEWETPPTAAGAPGLYVFVKNTDGTAEIIEYGPNDDYNNNATDVADWLTLPSGVVFSTDVDVNLIQTI